MEDKLIDISEKLGNVRGRLSSLEVHIGEIDSKIDLLDEKIDENTKLLASMRVTVAGIASGISVVFTVVITSIWDFITQKK